MFLRLLPLPSADVAVPARVPDQVLALIEDMGGQGGPLVQDGKRLEVPLEDQVHRGPVNDGLTLWLVQQLPLGGGGAEDVLGSLAPPGVIPTADLHLVMEVESRMRPAQELLDQRVVNLPPRWGISKTRCRNTTSGYFDGILGRA